MFRHRRVIHKTMSLVWRFSFGYTVYEGAERQASEAESGEVVSRLRGAAVCCFLLCLLGLIVAGGFERKLDAWLTRGLIVKYRMGGETSIMGKRCQLTIRTSWHNLALSIDNP